MQEGIQKPESDEGDWRSSAPNLNRERKDIGHVLASWFPVGSSFVALRGSTVRIISSVEKTLMNA
jgi:hypothetical protein